MNGRRGIVTRVAVTVGIFAACNLVLARAVSVLSGAAFRPAVLVIATATAGLLGVGFFAIAVVQRYQPDLARRLEARFMLLLGWAVSLVILVGIVLVLGRIGYWTWRAFART